MKKVIIVLAMVMALSLALVSCSGPSWQTNRDEVCCTIVGDIIDIDGSAKLYIADGTQYECIEVNDVDDFAIAAIRAALNETGDVLRIAGTWCEVYVTIGSETEASNIINLYDYSYGLINVTVVGSGATYDAVTKGLSDPNWRT